MIFSALYAIAKRGILNVSVIGIAAQHWSLEQLRIHATDSIQHSGDDRYALDYLFAWLQYVGGDYNVLSTFDALKRALEGIRRPAHNLAISPGLFLRLSKVSAPSV